MSDEQASRRREVARLHHPDLGGDPAEFIKVMRAFEAGHNGVSTSSRAATVDQAARLTVIHTTPVSRTLRNVKTSTRYLIREVRQHLPRSLPGSRRYGRL